MKKFITICLFATGLLGSVCPSKAQTTLSGDHVVDGDLSVGTTANKANVTINGETGSLALPGLGVSGDGGVFFTGIFGTGKIPATGAGARFMWYPKKAATRFGAVAADQWDDANIGNYSFASGYNVKASGTYAAAMGSNSVASGGSALALGANSSAVGSSSVALGSAKATGYMSVSIGGFPYTPDGTPEAIGDWSVAIGSFADATGAMAFALQCGEAISELSFAVGTGSLSSGPYSVAMGGGTSVGDWSFALGNGITAVAAYSLAVGRNGTLEGNPTQWVETDPLFVVGNGTGSSSDPAEVKNRNAFAVYKNGDVKIPKRQGDILMGEFGNPE